jgi:hypothetical protein
MQIAYPDSNRIGWFKISHESLQDGAHAPMLKALFGLCVILELAEHESGRGKMYTAASELFQPLAEGEEIPEYRIEFAFDQAFPDPEHEAKRIDNGRFGFVAIRKLIVRVPPATLAVLAPAPGRNLH